MDPLLISFAVGLARTLLDLIFKSAFNSSSSSARKELELFHSKLLANIVYWEEKCAEYFPASAGFTPKALDKLEGEMADFLTTARGLLNRPRLKKEDVRSFRDEVMTAFQFGMSCTAFELLGDVRMELKAIKKMLEKRPAMVQIITINVDQHQALGNPKLGELLSRVLNTPHATEAFQEHLNDVLPNGIGHITSTRAVASTSQARPICKSEEEQLKKKVESVQLEQFIKEEKLEMTCKAAMKETEENRRNNPNLSMSFSTTSDHVSRQDDDGNIEVALEGQSTEVVSAMIGVRPMKVSETLRYFYFEVKVVEMVELSGTSKTDALAGVGVGLATRKKFEKYYKKMVGWYPESFGYDGRMGEVYSERRFQGAFRIGILAKGDTLGIGLLQLPSQRRPAAIFVVKNGVIQGCTQEHGLKQSSIDHLHPVVTLASNGCAKLCVNFHGPFHLPSGSDLAAALEITR